MGAGPKSGAIAGTGIPFLLSFLAMSSSDRAVKRVAKSS
jgi:hypothetical protein